MEKEILSKEKIPFTTIPAAGLHGTGLLTLPGNLVRLMRGYLESRRILKEFKPDVIFFTGGYIGVPVAKAADYTPSVVFIPDIEPGKALNYLVKRASVITTVSEDTQKFIPSSKKVIATGYPIRADLTKWTYETGQKRFGITSEFPILLVFGGSKGAQSINQALISSLSQLLEEIEVIHISGPENWEETQNMIKLLPDHLSKHYHGFPFLYDGMGAALTCADLAVCRAGASTLGELPFFGLPAVLVPYPHAWNYQYTNAEYLARHGGAIILEDQNLKSQLFQTVNNLIKDKDKLQSMRKAMKQLAKPEAAMKIGQILQGTALKEGGDT